MRGSLFRRFTPCLHYSYAVQTSRNLLYSYSQKAWVEAALDNIAFRDDNAYRRLLLTGVGMFYDTSTPTALIFLDLVWQLDVDGSTFTRKRNSHCRREPLLHVARKVVQYAYERV